MKVLRAFLYDLIIREFVNVPRSVAGVLFVAGFALLAVQILGVRVLGPWLGTALPVWAAVIGTMLTGSALGYYGGGVLADRKRASSIVGWCALLAALVIVLIPMTREVVPLFHASLPYHAALFLATITVLFPPALILSALITYVIRLFVESLDTVSQVHGDLYTIATVGSISAVFVTSYVLIPTFSVPHIFYGIGVVLGVVGILSLKKGSMYRGASTSAYPDKENSNESSRSTPQG